MVHSILIPLCIIAVSLFAAVFATIVGDGQYVVFAAVRNSTLAWHSAFIPAIAIFMSVFVMWCAILNSVGVSMTNHALMRGTKTYYANAALSLFCGAFVYGAGRGPLTHFRELWHYADAFDLLMIIPFTPLILILIGVMTDILERSKYILGKAITHL